MSIRNTTACTTAAQTLLLASLAAGLAPGCASNLAGPRVIFIDGAGWYSGDAPVRRGLRLAGFPGPVERFGWSSLLGPVPDHVAVGPNHPRTAVLAKRITRLRQADPDGRIIVMGLSAGTVIAVHALEKLPDDVAVDYVVLLSSSMSSRHDLTQALRHVKGRLYATSSPHDAILAAAGSTGLNSDPPAGLVGFSLPPNASAEQKQLYRKVVSLPWRPEYVAYGWDGGHVSTTRSDFIRVVIAPRILDDLPHPLDQPIVSAKE